MKSRGSFGARWGVFLAVLGSAAVGGTQDPVRYEYRVLATSKTSTMEAELNEAAADGFRYGDVMGGETAFGGNEVVVVMSREKDAPHDAVYSYRLLATGKTSTMQRELQEASDAGFEAVGQTVFTSTFGGREVVILLERDSRAPSPRYEYKLLATSRTGTMQKELFEAGAEGFALLGLTVAETRFGGAELVSVLRRPRSE